LNPSVLLASATRAIWSDVATRTALACSIKSERKANPIANAPIAMMTTMRSA
jgi:xanthine/uracil/vitamin C permease (AzgA family)